VINRIMAWIEKRARVPGSSSGTGAGMRCSLDFSLLNWGLIQNFVLKGLWFSIFLTVVATAGGIFFGTLLALMRLSGSGWTRRRRSTSTACAPSRW
jgi:ABC-type amino acid transport system permease subunit